MRELSKTETSIFDTPQVSHGKYDWATWTNGHAFAAKQGEDFAGKVASFKYLLKSHASKLGVTVDIRELSEDEVAFRFGKPAEEPATEEPAEEQPSEPTKPASRKSVRAA